MSCRGRQGLSVPCAALTAVLSKRLLKPEFADAVGDVCQTGRSTTI